MAQVPPSPSSGLYKTVQELIENGDELPERYIWSGPIDLTVPLASEIPLIDVAHLSSSSSSSSSTELLRLRSALTSWGCFQAVNHGVDASFLDEVRRLSREFFHLPITEKQKCARQGDDYEGYGTDLVLFNNQSLDWNDRLYLQVAPNHHHKLHYWPLNPPSFR